MKNMLFLLTMMVFVAGIASAETVISYSYDKQYRLVEAKYSEASKVIYVYDAANNLTFCMSVTDMQKMQSFLIQLAMQSGQSDLYALSRAIFMLPFSVNSLLPVIST